MRDEQAARIAHAAVRAHQYESGDPQNPPWDDAPDHTRTGYIHAVRLVWNGVNDQDRHTAWVEHRREHGWTFGPRRDEHARTHPWLVDWDDLPPRAQQRAWLFAAVTAVLR